MRIVRTELQAWNGVSDRLSFFWPRRWLDPHYALPAGLGEEQWGASELRAYTVPPRSAMSGGRTGTRSARAKPCSDCASSCPIFREQAIEPIAGTHERSATKVFRAGLSMPGHPSSAQWDDVSCCEGFRTTAHRDSAGRHRGRRPKASREGTRGELRYGMCRRAMAI
jgi:hypothetical protein